MRCPECGSGNLGCMESRESTSHPGRRRRRHKCRDCGARFSTIEITLEEYENLCGIRECQDRARLAEFRRRVMGLLLAMTKETEGERRAVAENLLQQILRMEG